MTAALLSTVQAGIISTLKTLVTPVNVIAHGGRFTEHELPVLLNQSPCILVSCAGIVEVKQYEPTQWQGVTQWAAYCFGADTASSRADQAMDLAEAVLNQMQYQLWGISSTIIEYPSFSSARADNLYSGHVNNLRVAIWGVTWNQLITFP